MRVLIAFDSFKESLTAAQACAAFGRGWRRARPGDTADEAPMADGGEGTVDALTASPGWELRKLRVRGPLGQPVEAAFGWQPEEGAAVVEMAAASGLALVAPAERDVGRASTWGTGELIRHAWSLGAKTLIVGLGGSATNDGGAGMAQALGFRLLDGEGKDIPPGGLGLLSLARIEPGDAICLAGQCRVRVACDVRNPLCGDNGASAVFGPQKGAAPSLVSKLDAGLANLAACLERDLGVRVADMPGSGAAGGLAAGLVGFCGATLESGVELAAAAQQLPRRIARADLVITGEGRLDGQTLSGKAPLGVARLAREAGKPVIGVGGAVAGCGGALHEAGFGALVSIAPGPCALEESMAHAGDWLEEIGLQLGRIWSQARGDAPGKGSQ